VSFTFLLIFLGTAFASKTSAIIHKRLDYFIDIELSKKTFTMDCSGGEKDDNSILGFNLLDSDIYYSFFYRRVRTVKECLQIRKEYLSLLKNQKTVRIVGDHPDESIISESDRKMIPAPYNKANKKVSAFFIRLQSGNKCRAYFSEDCDLPKNYWGGLMPEK
jgi:hypothetical protein